VALSHCRARIIPLRRDFGSADPGQPALLGEEPAPCFPTSHGPQRLTHPAKSPRREVMRREKFDEAGRSASARAQIHLKLRPLKELQCIGHGGRRPLFVARRVDQLVESLPNCRGVIDPVAFFETESLS
jgi:hypothetical protein